MILHLGVIDIAYADEEGATTTGEVATILESSYHIVEIFAIEREDQIAEWLAEAMVDQIRDVVSGAPVARNPFFGAEEKIRLSFHKFIETEEIARINPDTPTQAALEGRTKRRKNATEPHRVSFRDTGQYLASFRAWVDIGSQQSLPNFLPMVTGLPGLWNPT